MFKKIEFIYLGFDSLFEYLNSGLLGYFANPEQIGGMSNIWLFFTNGEVIKIYSEMNKLEGWEEAGSLILQTVNTKDSGESIPEMVAIPLNWMNIAAIDKMIVLEENFKIENGLKIKAANGDEFIIVCGAGVYTIQVSAPFFNAEFKPEYDLSRYEYEVISS
jgi:hypothetical protein